MRYTFKGSDPSSLTVKERGSREIVLPKSHGATIVQQNSRSSKPAWIGAAIGGGTGVAMGVGIRSDEYPKAKWEVAAVTLGLIGAAAGFTVGYLATEDPPDAVLYQDLPGNCSDHDPGRLLGDSQTVISTSKGGGI